MPCISPANLWELGGTAPPQKGVTFRSWDAWPGELTEEYLPCEDNPLSAQGKLPSLRESKRFKVGNRRDPERNPHMLVRRVPFLTTRGVPSTFELSSENETYNEDYRKIPRKHPLCTSAHY